MVRVRRTRHDLTESFTYYGSSLEAWIRKPVHRAQKVLRWRATGGREALEALAVHMGETVNWMAIATHDAFQTTGMIFAELKEGQISPGLLIRPTVTEEAVSP